MGKKKQSTLQAVVNQALCRLTLHLSTEPCLVTLHVVPVPQKNAPLEEQVIRFQQSRIIVPGNLAKDTFPDYSEKDAYAEHRQNYCIGALAGVPIFFQHNPLVKPLLANNRVFEFMFWSSLIRSYCGFVQNLHVLGEKEACRYASRVRNNARTDDDPLSIGLDYAAQFVQKHGARQLRRVVEASTTAELHDMVKPREALFLQYARQNSESS